MIGKFLDPKKSADISCRKRTLCNGIDSMDRESEWENGYRFSSQLRVRILDTIHLHPYLDTDLVNRWFTVSYGEPSAREEIFYFKRKMWHARGVLRCALDSTTIDHRVQARGTNRPIRFAKLRRISFCIYRTNVKADYDKRTIDQLSYDFFEMLTIRYLVYYLYVTRFLESLVLSKWGYSFSNSKVSTCNFYGVSLCKNVFLISDGKARWCVM